MHHLYHNPAQAISRNIGYSAKAERCISYFSGTGIKLRKIDWYQLHPVICKLRQSMTLATDDAINQVLSRNSNVVMAGHFTDDPNKIIGIVAYLPLNEYGLRSLLENKFDGIEPNVDFICHQDEAPVAIYFWLVYMPAILARALPAISAAIDEIAPQGCPLFTRTTTAHAKRLSLAMGFAYARNIYPACDPDMLVIHPQRHMCNIDSRKYDIKIARNFEDINQIFSIRSIVYIAEQPCYYSEEFDGNDFCATHIIASMDGEPAGCIRMRFFSSFAKIERLAVRPEYRNSRLAFMLARAAITHCQKKGYAKLYGHARLDLVRFWKMFGFRPRADRPEFAFARIKYVELEMNCVPDKRAISLDDDPMILIRPEGDWHRRGPLDRSASEHDKSIDPQRFTQIRTIFGQQVHS